MAFEIIDDLNKQRISNENLSKALHAIASSYTKETGLIIKAVRFDKDTAHSVMTDVTDIYRNVHIEISKK